MTAAARTLPVFEPFLRMTSDIQQRPEHDTSTVSAEAHDSMTPDLDAAHRDNRDDSRRIREAAISLLSQGAEMLEQVSADTYTQRHPAAFNASIGGHYRHCLDHFTSLLRSLDHTEVDYDHRERDARIESEPDYAVCVTRQLQWQLEQIPLSAFASPMRSRCSISYTQGPSPVTASTFGREIVYVIAHAIHHFALISIMARLVSMDLPEGFGVAPSTLHHQTRMATQ